MPLKGSAAAGLCLCLLALQMASSTSCLVRRRIITRKGGQPTQTLLTTDKANLIKEIADNYAAIQTLNITVDMVPALGTANKGKITEYKDVRAYIKFRKPNDIRLTGLYPVVRSEAFDMVSNGSQFRLYIPSKERFVEGTSEMEPLSQNKWENLRPQHFLDALIVSPNDPAHDETTLENLTDEDNAVYILSVNSHDAAGQLVLRRQLWFDRLKLHLIRQLIFDLSGDILTDARYSDWQQYDNVAFPKEIDIERPKDEYGVVITTVTMEMNKPLSDDKFQLEQPEGSQLQVLGADSGKGTDKK